MVILYVKFYVCVCYKTNEIHNYLLNHTFVNNHICAVSIKKQLNFRFISAIPSTHLIRRLMFDLKLDEIEITQVFISF